MTYIKTNDTIYSVEMTSTENAVTLTNHKAVANSDNLPANATIYDSEFDAVNAAIAEQVNGENGTNTKRIANVISDIEQATDTFAAMVANRSYLKRVYTIKPDGDKQHSYRVSYNDKYADFDLLGKLNNDVTRAAVISTQVSNETKEFTVFAFIRAHLIDRDNKSTSTVFSGKKLQAGLAAFYNGREGFTANGRRLHALKAAVGIKHTQGTKDGVFAEKLSYRVNPSPLFSSILFAPDNIIDTLAK